MSANRMNSKRWQVERTQHNFEDVGADYMKVTESGALLFTSGHPFDPTVVIVYAPGQWQTVFEEEE